MSKEDALKEAEAFVRKAVARISKTPVSERAIKLAAKKVAQIVPVQEKPRGKATI